MNHIKLEMKDISIEFPGVKALKNVNFTTETGVSHALVGANGAGKSTLLKVLCGVYNHYTGSIFIDGKEAHVRSPKAAKQLGIQVVYQEVDTALIPYLSVAENIMLDSLVNDMGSRQFIKWKNIHTDASKILEQLNVDIDTKKVVSQLPLAHKQMVLIARAIYKECRFLILDEPTAPLSHSETEELFRVIRDLIKRNMGVIFISHRLSELWETCDQITVLRDGEFVGHHSIRNIKINEIIEMMLGRCFKDNYPKHQVNIGEKIFEIENLCDGKKIKNINLSIHAGEIIGIAGLVGAGKSELCKALFGATSVHYSKAIIKDRLFHIKSPFTSVSQGVALVPEERRSEGILVHESITTNLTSASLSDFCGMMSFINFNKERIVAQDMIRKLDIKTPSENQTVCFLSGGNQQKIAVGKWLIAKAEVYIFDEPTKGIDVGAKTDIFNLIGKLAEEGRGIIFASCELTEIMGITDRVYVMYNGRIVKELNTKDTCEKELLFYSTGGK